MTPQQQSYAHRARRLAVRWAVILSVLYLGVVIVFSSFESYFVFHPAPADSWLTPVDSSTQDVWFVDESGTRLHGWWLPPKRPDAGAVLVAHGNGGNISYRGPLAAELNDALGVGVLLFEYPGYGKSAGTPSEAGCYAAGEAALTWLTDEAKTPPGRIILLGESLGGGVAVELATRHDHRALVLLYTFTSLPAAAKYHFPWLPTHTLMRNRFDNLAKIGRCHRPVFIAHGTADEVVPFRQGEELFAAANEPKQFLPLEGAAHGLLPGDQVWDSLARFLSRHAP